MMKRMMLALLAVTTLSGCAQVQEWDRQLGARLDAFADRSAPVYTRDQVGKINAVPGGGIAYTRQGNERQPTKAEIEYARKSSADFDAMRQRDREERVKMEETRHKMSPEQACAVIAEMVNAHARQQAYESGDFRQLEQYNKQKVYKECLESKK